MNIFVKIASIFVIVLIGVGLAFVAINTQWITASVAAYSAQSNRTGPIAVVELKLTATPTALAKLILYPSPTPLVTPTAPAIPTAIIVPVVLIAPTENTCLSDGRIYYKSIGPLFAQWHAGMKIALPLSPELLGPAITQLQEVQRKMIAVDAPPCLRVAHDTTIRAMDEGIKMYLGMMANEPGSVVREHFNNFNTLLDDAKSQISISVGN